MNTPFIKCLDPQLVRNKYTGETRFVACGCCKACNLQRHHVMSFRCSIHENDFKYCYFVTLTYNNDNIPLCKPVYDSSMHGYFLISQCDRHINYNNEQGFPEACCGFLSDEDVPKIGLNALLKKINLNGFIPYAYYRDVQLFLKRIRKQYYKYDKEEKIKYFMVSEYGPIHFRPHYHLIIFHNSDKIHKVWNKIISPCWPYGRIDASTSRGSVTSYVASYVNSSCTLPRVFTLGELKPKCTHSAHLGCEIPYSQIAKIYELPSICFVRQSYNFGKGNIQYMPWRSYEDFVFPRCKSYSTKSRSELYRTYNLISEARRKFGRQTIRKYARLIYSLIFNLDYKSNLVCPKRDYLREYFVKSLDIEKFVNNHMPLKGKYFYDDWWLQQIEQELYISKHFRDFICQDNDLLFNIRINKLIDYYNTKDLFKLKQFYEQQSEFSNKGSNKLDLMLFYDNLFDFDNKHLSYVPNCVLRLYFQLGGLNPNRNIFDVINFKKTILFKNFYKQVQHEFDESIKHKKQNDLNNIFL